MEIIGGNKMARKKDVEAIETVPVEAPVEKKIPEFQVKVSNCKLLNIRKAPSKDAEVVAVLPAGEVLTSTDDQTKMFIEVKTSKGIKGFAMKEFLSVI